MDNETMELEVMDLEPPRLEYLEHRVFLGLNAANEQMRRRCKALLAGRMKSVVYMTFDQVGRCDDVIWRYSRRLQDPYYPFMDAVHSHRCLQRDGYEASTLHLAAHDPRLQGLPADERMLLARAIERQAVVYTLESRLLSRPDSAGAPAAAQRSGGRVSGVAGIAVPPGAGAAYRGQRRGGHPMYGGVMVPLVTPLCGDGSVCPASVERLVASVRPAATGLIPALSSGEGWQLEVTQWRDMVSLTRRFAGGLPVLAGIELPTTRQAMERAQLARWLEVAAVVVPPPFAGHSDQVAGASETDIVLQHLRAVAGASRLPVFLYNEPKLTGRRLSADTLVALCRSGLLAGVKDSSGDVEITRALVAARTGVPVFQGWENLCQVTTPGVDGYILPLSNLEPALCRAMWEAPGATLQGEMLEHCSAHDLLGEHWYLGLKRELYRRGIISSDRPASAVRASD